MSPSNKGYLITNNPCLTEKIELNPNSIDVSRVINRNTAERSDIRRRYGLSETSTIIVYGGNLGIPQGISFLVDFIKFCSTKRFDIEFVIAGSGTESKLLENTTYRNLHFFGKLDKKEFDSLVAACDVGLVSLDSRFSIPNFPSRLLTYLSCALPILCFVDNVTDIGKIAEKNGFGVNALHGYLQDCFQAMTNLVDCNDLYEMGQKGKEYLISHYDTRKSYEVIKKHILDDKC